MKFSLIVILLLVSCSKSEIYEPLHASYMGKGVQISFTDTSGNDLLLNETFISNLSIYGTLSNKELPFSIEKRYNDEFDKNYICFSADLPDVKDVIFNKDGTEGRGSSSVELRVNGLKAKLLCNYKYHAVKSEVEVYGNNSIRIESIEYMGEKVTRGDNPINSDFILNFRVENDAMSLK